MAGLVLALLLASSPANQFVKANGVTLQYVDWGGPDTPSEAPRIVDPHWERCGKDAHVFGALRRSLSRSSAT
jgi:hypothetical protein